MDGHRTPRREAGFSLIEVLVALTILAVGLLGLALFQVTAIKGNAFASMTTIATQLAQEQMETYRRTAWTSIVSPDINGYSGDTSTVPLYAALPDAAADNVIVNGVMFFRVVRVAPNVASASLKTITVWTCWQDDRRYWHNVMLVTQRTNVGT